MFNSSVDLTKSTTKKKKKKETLRLKGSHDGGPTQESGHGRSVSSSVRGLGSSQSAGSWGAGGGAKASERWPLLAWITVITLITL